MGLGSTHVLGIVLIGLGNALGMRLRASQCLGVIQWGWGAPKPLGIILMGLRSTHMIEASVGVEECTFLGDCLGEVGEHVMLGDDLNEVGEHPYLGIVSIGLGNTHALVLIWMGLGSTHSLGIISMRLGST